MRGVALFLLVLLSFSSCGSGVGGRGEPCLEDGACKSGYRCNEDDLCEPCCCADRECGDDGCGVSCGTCPDGVFCVSNNCVDLFVDIEGGSFDMGSESGDPDEQPVHRVTVSSFEMTRSEVTYAQYRPCMEDGACGKPGTRSLCNWYEEENAEFPVNCIDWHQAVDFCEWAGGRLPTEAEWEYAARSEGKDITYPWGDEAITCERVYIGDEEADCEWKPAVCSREEGNTSQGLCDMAGSLREWVQDLYHPDYVGAPADGSAWEPDEGGAHVLRGGSYASGPHDLRTTVRFWYYPGIRHYLNGFRCVR